MLLLAAALLATAPTPAVAAPGGPLAKGKSSTCPRATEHYAWQRGKSVRPQKLNQLPPANAYYTVYRVIGGCEVPVVVRYGVGGR